MFGVRSIRIELYFEKPLEAHQTDMASRIELLGLLQDILGAPICAL